LPYFDRCGDVNLDETFFSGLRNMALQAGLAVCGDRGSHRYQSHRSFVKLHGFFSFLHL
jgi:hypothetical protein